MSEKRNGASRTREQVDALINEWKESGLGKKEFCIQKELNYQTFVSWFYFRKKKLKRNKGFIPLQVDAISTGLFAEVQLSNSRRIVFHQAVNVDVLQAILKC